MYFNRHKFNDLKKSRVVTEIQATKYEIHDGSNIFAGTNRVEGRPTRTRQMPRHDRSPPSTVKVAALSSVLSCNINLPNNTTFLLASLWSLLFLVFARLGTENNTGGP